MQRSAQLLLWLFLCSFGLLPSLRADPENFMVGDFIFVRPPAWKWMDLNDPSQSVRLRLTEPGRAGGVDILAYLKPAKSRDKIFADWAKTRFRPPTPDAPAPKPEKVTVDKRAVYYMEYEGTYLNLTREKVLKEYPKHTSILGHIDGPKQAVLMRITGPTAWVQELKPAFRAMIENALKEAP